MHILDCTFSDAYIPPPKYALLNGLQKYVQFYSGESAFFLSARSYVKNGVLTGGQKTYFIPLGGGF